MTIRYLQLVIVRFRYTIQSSYNICVSTMFKFLLISVTVLSVLSVPQRRFLTDSEIPGNCLRGYDNCHHCGSYTIIRDLYLCCPDCGERPMTSPSGGGGIACHCNNNIPL
ncbi:uncharacterized protein LOC125646171 [Ostrea edulis]|uniref:uncharacterized protein LOC125646171 n=1 Tax=Ostrea edulis TaxID=37623 RepID=UPI0024AF9C0D|nr:uncharacterized protein LOC125646171 [Ostrea edulis]